jgi:hypothetical protein
MSVLHQWAAAHGVGLAALQDLQRRLGILTAVPDAATASGPAKSEAWAQSAVRLEACQKGLRLWRNNVGALLDKQGRLVRYGLANDSANLNAQVKSGDLIGWRPVTVTPAHVGHKLAVFVSREIKEPGWQYTGTAHEQAQLAWAHMINAAGGDARFADGPGSL